MLAQNLVHSLEPIDRHGASCANIDSTGAVTPNTECMLLIIHCAEDSVL
jgi:hypothetical protein